MAHFAVTLEHDAPVQPLDNDPCSNYIILQRFEDFAVMLFSFCVSSYKNRYLAPLFMQMRVSLPELLVTMPGNDQVLHVVIGETRKGFHSHCGLGLFHMPAFIAHEMHLVQGRSLLFLNSSVMKAEQNRGGSFYGRFYLRHFCFPSCVPVARIAYATKTRETRRTTSRNGEWPRPGAPTVLFGRLLKVVSIST